MTLPSRLPEILLAVMEAQPRALQDNHYPRWHLAPATGLMNDPNGFIYFADRYHLFYQWNPLSCSHSYKCWGHWSSTDLLHWQHEPIALMPDEEYDRSGCYSGSAVENNGKMTLCYTGNVKYEDGGRTAWQCLAVENQHRGFDKLGPVIPLPEGYTGHVRDPKIWSRNGQWYMVLGAQSTELQGKVLLWQSEDLLSWQLRGEIAGNGVNGLENAGYMWECPDLFPLDGEDILICCPQGMTKEDGAFLNTYPCTWLSGTLDYGSARFNHGLLHELDAGFEFYAPQTTLAKDGRRLLVGWMGVPEGEEMLQPTRANGWMHQMTCLRELSFKQGKLLQQPASELKALRHNEQSWQGNASKAPSLPTGSLELKLTASGPLSIDFGNALTLYVDKDGIRLERCSLLDDTIHCRYWRGSVSALHVLCDSSSVEIFINTGEGVMTNRYFPEPHSVIRFQGDSTITLRYWSLSPTTRGFSPEPLTAQASGNGFDIVLRQ